MTARDRLKDIPDLAPGGANLTEWSRAVKETLQTFRGLRGDKLDKALTNRDVANGALDGVAGAGIVAVGPPGPPGPPSPPGSYQPVYVPDLTAPPTPSGLLVTPGFTKIIVQCDAQTYTQGHGHDRTNVYGSKWALSDPTPPTFSEAVRLWSFLGTVDSYATDAATRWCIWIKWQSLDGVESSSPAGGTNGFQATTGVDIPLVLESLAGQITISELATSLATPIGLITAPFTVPGSVDARIKTEETLRVAADVTTLASAQSYVGTFTYNKATIDGAFAGLETTLRSAFAAADGVTLTNAQSYVNSFTYARSVIDGSFASTLSTLRSEFQAADVLVRLQAQADTAVYAYSLANGTALAGQVTTLSASVNSPTTGNNPTYAALQSEATARATLDGNVRALYTMRVEVSSGGRTVTGGFGLAGTATAFQGPLIEFGVMANRFWVGAPVGSGIADTQLFTVQTTSWSDNGVTRPPGVFIDSAYIRNLSALYATVQTLVADQITAADISVSKLTAGTIRVGASMQSTGFTSGPGGTGWRMDGAGNLEASGVTIRGAVFASSGLFSGSVVVGSSPAISGTTMTGTGALFNATGTFAFGTSTRNAVYNGTDAPRLNGDWVGTGNLQTGAVTDVKLSAGVLADIASRLRRDANEILGAVISVDVVGSPAGFRAGTLTWDASGARTGGSGVAMTPLGLVAYNGATPTFTINASTGAATFAGNLSAATGTFAGSLLAATGSFSGSVTATSGQIGGIGISASSIQSNDYVSGVSGWRLSPTSAQLPATTIIGQLTTTQLATAAVTDTKLGLSSFTASIPGGNISLSGLEAGHQAYGSRLVSVSGGVSPYSYSWDVVDDGHVYRSAGITAGHTTDTATFAGSADGQTVFAVATCHVRDSNGRATFATINITASHSVDTGGGSGGEG